MQSTWWFRDFSADDEPSHFNSLSLKMSQYQDLEIDLLHKVATDRWQDLVALCQALGLKIVVQ
jgi:hypothetical protein